MSGRGEDILDFVEGRFLYSATPDGQRAGYKVIFMMFNNMKNMACSVLPRAYLLLVRACRQACPSQTFLFRLLTGTLVSCVKSIGFAVPYFLFFVFVHYRTLFVTLPTVKDAGFWTVMTP